MSVSVKEVREAVAAQRDEYMAGGGFASLAEINAGSCGAFASDVYHRLGGYPAVHGVLDHLRVDDFLLPPEDEDGFNDGGPFDRELLAEHWPGVRPTQGLDWDDLDALSAAAGFSSGTHEWLHCEGIFFDAEAPDGVSNFFELPFFQRVVAGWIQEGKPTADQGVADVAP